MAIRMRRGLESELDISKAIPGEWLVSTDTKYVRMCFAPGIVLRMATYEAFEADVSEIQNIISEARNIHEAVLRINSEIKNAAVVVEDYSVMTKSYAVGGTGTRENEDVDNAKYYYEQAKHISQGLNGLIPLGTISFENIPTKDILTNGMYNISNDFTSDERFLDGGGIQYGKGSNIYYTVNGFWDVLAASDVKGIRGAKEDSFRQGNVTLTPEDLGAASEESLAQKKIFFGLESVGMSLNKTLQEVYDAMPDGSMLKLHVSNGSESIIFQQSLPTYSAGEVIIYRGTIARGWVEYKQYTNGVMWRNHYYAAEFKGWDNFVLNNDFKKAESTTIVSSDEAVIMTSGITNEYTIKNGWCFVRADMTISDNTTHYPFALPKPALSYYTYFADQYGGSGILRLGSDGNCRVGVETANERSTFVFSYPIAE